MLVRDSFFRPEDCAEHLMTIDDRPESGFELIPRIKRVRPDLPISSRRSNPP